MRAIRPPTLILGLGSWLAYMVGYGLVTLLRWIVVTTYRVIRWLVLLAVELATDLRRSRQQEQGNVIPLRRKWKRADPMKHLLFAIVALSAALAAAPPHLSACEKDRQAAFAEQKARMQEQMNALELTRLQNRANRAGQRATILLLR